MIGLAQRFREVQFADTMASIAAHLEKALTRDKITIDKLKEVSKKVQPFALFLLSSHNQLTFLCS